MIPFQTAFFARAFQQVIDYAAVDGANVSECHQAAEHIRDGDCESWYLAWMELAEHVRLDARHTLLYGKNDGRAAFLRAALYYQVAGQFLERTPGDARLAITAQASQSCFATAMRLSPPGCEIQEIAWDHERYSAYLYRNDTVVRSRATLLIVGIGATPLSLYLTIVTAVLQSVRQCLTVSVGESADAVMPAKSLLAIVPTLALVDPACLALMVFREANQVAPRFAYPLGRGTAGDITAALDAFSRAASSKNDPMSDFQITSLSDFRQHLLRYLA